MLFLCYSDIHFYHGWTEFNPESSTGRKKWLEHQIEVKKQILGISRQYKVAGILFSGDLVHKRTYLHTTVNNAILDLYKESDIPEYLIEGNHDRLDQRFNATQAVDGVGKAKLLKDGETVGLISAKETVTLYGTSPGGKIPERLKDIPGTHIVLAHGTLQGASSQSGFELTSGYLKSDFKDFSCCCLGDIHAKGIYSNVLIPGAPMQQSWGDESLHCGCWLLSTDGVGLDPDLDWKPLGTCMVAFLPLIAPRFISVTKDNFDTITERIGLNQPDPYNYYDFRFSREVNETARKGLKRIFPNSYLNVAPIETSQKSAVQISRKGASTEEILDGYYNRIVKGKNPEQFVKKALEFLLSADPKQISRGQKSIEINWLAAENFLAFKSIRIDIDSLSESLYQVDGTESLLSSQLMETSLYIDHEAMILRSFKNSRSCTENFMFTESLDTVLHPIYRQTDGSQ